MAIELFCNHSAALAKLFSANLVSIDGVEFTPFHTFNQIQMLRKAYIDLPFQFHASHLDRYPWSKQTMQRRHQVCSESRWISLHLSPIPAWIIYPALKFGVPLHVHSPDHLVERMIVRIRKLKHKMLLPIILENMPALPALDTQIESTPETISRILQETGCDMLLDLGHARIAAAHRKIDVKEYLGQLPLSSVRQIHVSGIREQNSIFFDAHETLQEEDYALLEWTLERTLPEIVTLEYFQENASGLQTMLNRLNQVIVAASS